MLDIVKIMAMQVQLAHWSNLLVMCLSGLEKAETPASETKIPLLTLLHRLTRKNKTENPFLTGQE